MYMLQLVTMFNLRTGVHVRCISAMINETRNTMGAYGCMGATGIGIGIGMGVGNVRKLGDNSKHEGWEGRGWGGVGEKKSEFEAECG